MNNRLRRKIRDKLSWIETKLRAAGASSMDLGDDALRFGERMGDTLVARGQELAAHGQAFGRTAERRARREQKRLAALGAETATIADRAFQQLTDRLSRRWRRRDLRALAALERTAPRLLDHARATIAETPPSPARRALARVRDAADRFGALPGQTRKPATPGEKPVSTVETVVAAGIAFVVFSVIWDAVLNRSSPEARLSQTTAATDAHTGKRGRGLWGLIWAVYERISRDNLILLAAGVAFYIMLSIFPGLAAFVSIYGLIGDPATLMNHLGNFSDLLPPAAFKLVTDAVQVFAAKPAAELNIAAVIGLGLAIWSARAGIAALMTGLSIANETVDKRSWTTQLAIALVLTAGSVVFGLFALAAIALLPAVLAAIPIDDTMRNLLSYGRWPVMAVLVTLALAILYRWGPYKKNPKWKWITVGSATATGLWLLASFAFSLYVSKFGSYDATYGSLSAVVVLLMWLWLSALVVLIGAEVDAELEYGDGEVTRPLPPQSP